MAGLPADSTLPKTTMIKKILGKEVSIEKRDQKYSISFPMDEITLIHKIKMYGGVFDTKKEAIETVKKFIQKNYVIIKQR